jgi:hypothetical protein
LHDLFLQADTRRGMASASPLVPAFAAEAAGFCVQAARSKNLHAPLRDVASSALF